MIIVIAVFFQLKLLHVVSQDHFQHQIFDISFYPADRAHNNNFIINKLLHYNNTEINANSNEDSSSCPGFDRTTTSVSFVYAGRNDDYVGIYNRMRVTFSLLLGQLRNVVSAKKKAEVIIISWGDDPTRRSLLDEIMLPIAASAMDYPNAANICVRIIKVPSQYTRDGFFSEFVAKNIGIRRAVGETIVTSNLDNFLSSNLLEFVVNNGRSLLGHQHYLRAMRFNINIQEGSVWWDRHRGYERVTTLPVPVDALALLVWMMRREGTQSQLEEAYTRQGTKHLDYVAKSDLLCSATTTSNITFSKPTKEYSAAAGDFTVASRDAWYNMSGYPEVYENNHLDGVQLCRFLQAGLKEIILRPNQPCSAFVFHQFHDVGRAGRKESNIGSTYSCSNEIDIENRLDRFVNKTGWGHVFDTFEEDVLSVEQIDEQTMMPYIIHRSKNVSRRKSKPKNVISYSLYGSSDRYTIGALENVRLASKIYPGWEVHFYHDATVPQQTLDELASFDYVKLFDVSDAAMPNPRAWRFIVALNETIGAYILRDVDSRLNIRERLAVDEWLGSNFTFHVMHDHPGHCGKPIQAGMWGGRAVVPEMRLVLYPEENATASLLNHWDDAIRLEEFVWPVVRQDVLHHDSFCCGKFNETMKSRHFPVARKKGTGEHVGSVYLPVLEGKLRDRDKNSVLVAVERTGC